jgi:superfamily II RNA helicase
MPDAGAVRTSQHAKRRRESEREREHDGRAREAHDLRMAQETPVVFSDAAVVLVEAFAAGQPFPLDPYQVESARHLAEGRSVLVAAPTGTGKTVVAEVGIWLARRAGQRAIYTAPLKALSNQKFRDLRLRYGADQVGLLTGDIVENPRAPIVVMTTEIYRNMLLEGCRAAQVTVADEAAALLAPVRERTEGGAADRHAAGTPVAADDVAELARQAALDEELSTVGCVIFDELHYLSDPSRGPVWEEAIIHSPAHVQLVGLSATVSNASELRRWIKEVHGSIALVWHDERAVPLEHYFFLDDALHLVQDANGQRVERFPDIGGEAKLARMRNRARRYTYGSAETPSTMAEVLRRRGGGAGRERERDTRRASDARQTTADSGEAAGAQPGLSQERQDAQELEQPKERQAPEPGEVLTALRDAELLPCIYFLPGRRAVETAAESAKGHLLVSPQQRARLHEEVQEWVGRLPAEDQKLDQVQRLAVLLPRGIAFHHAGLLPGLKVMVETLFQRGELRAVFATDTLALGVNMPARSVVLGSMSKFDGTQMRLMTPNEYQQLTGRAGRRGMDAKGAAILLYSPWDAFEAAFAALTAPLLPVTSAFTVRYNTVLNLWRPGDISFLRTALAASFREFQRRGGRLRRSGIEFDLATPQGRKAKQARRRQGQYLLSRAADAELNGTIYVLRKLGYIDQSDELTVKGRMLRALFHPAGMILTELIVNGTLDGLTTGELAEVASWFTFDDDRPLRNYETLSQKLMQVRREVYLTERQVLGLEDEEGLVLSPHIQDGFHGVALNWSRGFSLGGLLRRIDLAEGDLLVILNQTIDFLQQLQGAVGQVLDARDLWREAEAETRRGRWLRDLRERLLRLRPTLDAAWRGMLRGSVAQSRAIPSMVTPALVAGEEVEEAQEALPAIAMAEDEDPDETRQDRLEAGPETAEREA